MSTNKWNQVIGKWVLGGVAVLGAAGQALGATPTAPDNFSLLVDSANATEGRAIASFSYFASENGNGQKVETFYVPSYGTGSNTIREVTITYAANGTSTTASREYVSYTAWLAYIRSVNGVAHPEYTGSAPYGHGITVNPVAVTVNGTTYQPGQLAIIDDAPGNLAIPGGATLFNETKHVYALDLTKGTVGSGLGGTFDTTWDQAFTTLVTRQDLIDASGSTASGISNWGRQSGWSSNGQSLYHSALETTASGGIWRVDVSSGEPTQLHKEGGIKTEVAAISTSIRRFANTDGSVNGDQVIWGSNKTDAFNSGGVSYVVDDGTSGAKTPQVLLTAAQLAGVIESNGRQNVRKPVNGSDPGPAAVSAVLDAVTQDGEGNLYLYFTGTGTSYSLWRYDTEGRLAAVGSRDEALLFNANEQNTIGSGTSTNSTKNRLQYRGEVGYTNADGVTFDVPTVVYASTGLKGIVSQYAFKTGDFDRDNEVTTADILLFRDALDTEITTFNGYVGYGSTTDPTYTGYYEAASVLVNGVQKDLLKAVIDGDVAADAYTNYLKFDLNGNGLVTDKDTYLLSQFVPEIRGDVNLDGVVDISDLTILGLNWNLTGKSWSTADFNNDGVVDISDLTLLGLNWNRGYTSDLPSVGGLSFAEAAASFGLPVPEPMTLVLLQLGGLALLRRKR